MDVDPVILEFHARTARFQAELRRTTRSVDEHLGRQGAQVRKLEGEFRRSSDAIGTSLRGLAATLAAAFTGRELVNLIDSFTRFQNSLKVAGLEGERLASVQDRLFETGTRYGVSVNALADLYGKAEQAGRELGASQDELLKLTDAVAQSLLVTGTSTEQASGAVLGLSQALASGTVRAEELNQVNEGGLRPLLEAAAASERFGGSIAKLRNEVVEGKVSSEEFYQAILANTDLIEGKASKATLTLGGALTSLSDALARYVGEAAQTNGITGAATAGIKALADNIDILIPALTVLALVLTTRVAAGMLAATVNAVGLRVASLALAVQLNGTAAAARLAGSALLTAFGGPVGVAILAVGGAIGYFSYQAAQARTETERLTKAADEATTTAEKYKNKLRDAGVAVDNLGNKSSVAAGKVAGLSREMRTAAFLAENLLDKVGAASQVAALTNRLDDNRRQQRQKADEFSGVGTVASDVIQGLADPAGVIRNQAERARQLLQLRQEEAGILSQIDSVITAAENGVDLTDGPASVPGSPSSPIRTSPGSPGRTTVTDPAEVLRRFYDDQRRLDDEILQAKLSLATSVEDRADLERDILESQASARREEVNTNEDLNPEQRAALLELIDQLYGTAAAVDEQGNLILSGNRGLLGQAIAFREQAEIEQRNRDLAEDRGRAQLDALRLQFDLADTEGERRDIAMRILQAEDDLLRARLSSLANSKTIGEADAKRAQIALDALNDTAQARRDQLNRQYASPLERYAQDAKDTDQRVEEAAVRRIERLNETITDAMTNALGIEDPFLRDLIGIFLDKNVFGPLAEGLAAQGGGGDIFGGIIAGIGSLFGRASGGPVRAGQAYRVNEGASPGRVEAFVPNTSGQIIPLGRMNAMQGGGGAVVPQRVVVAVQLSDDLDARIVDTSSAVAVQFERQVSEDRMRQTAAFTLNQAGRPRL